MPSPDASALVDLTLYDKDAEDIYTAAKAAITSTFPDWTDDEAQLAVVFLQALAAEVADLGIMVNRLPGAILDGLLQLFSITRSLGTAPTATVTFTLTDTAGHTIPAGTRLRYDPGSGGEIVDFTTGADLVVAPAASTGVVAITATTNTDSVNALAIGTALTLIDAVAAVSTVALATSPSDGADEEADATWFQRGITTLARLVNTLVRPEHFTLAALAESGVYRATTFDRTNELGVTTDGHVAVAVCALDGVLLSSPAKATILADLQAMASAELTIHIIDPTITTQNIVATVAKTTGYTSGQVQTNVAAALAAFLDVNTWTWGGTIRFYDLIAVIEATEGVDHVVSLGTPAADVVLAGVANLAKLGTTTITVT